jgi:ABC-2 type transport system ATP-binding protein
MIETTGLTRTFGKTTAVLDLDLQVRAGEIYGFLGPNGAGKTTTIRMFCGLLRPSRGSIRIAGIDLQADAPAARHLFGFVPDTAPLYEYLTVIEYIGFVTSLYGISAATRDTRATAQLELLGLADQADDLCKSLSHGMRKKVHIAAMLTVAPRLLIMDEPTNGLDPKSTRVLKDVLVRARDAGTTVFLSTHVLDVAQEICDRIAILDRGRLLASGTMAELRAHDPGRSLEAVFLQLTERSSAGTPADAGSLGATDAAQ